MARPITERAKRAALLTSKGESVEAIAKKLRMTVAAVQAMGKRPGFRSYLASLTATLEEAGEVAAATGAAAKWEPGAGMSPDQIVEGSREACVRRLVRIVQTNPDDRVAIQAIDRLLDRAMPKRLDVKEDRVVRMVIEGEEAKRWSEAMAEVATT